ncbi:MAG: ATP-binding protein [Candidatus Bathyarchaeia archaeon]
MTGRIVYPFTAVVGQERAKTALILNAVDPRLGGVLISGPKGSGKSTIVRSLEGILPAVESVEGCVYNCNPNDLTHLCPACREKLREGKLNVRLRPVRVVELPLGATEEGLLGTVDAEEVLRSGVKKLSPGLLGRANQNILYVEDLNLLSDHLVDCILDPAASGWVSVEREGISLQHPSKFILIASMNPEEGGLRPQILDRFALKVDIEPLTEPELRAEIIRRNLAFEEDPQAFYKMYEEAQERLRRRIKEARERLEKVSVPEDVMRGIGEACSRFEVEGVRSDIAILKAARALAAFEGRDRVEPGDALNVFDLALSHRLKGPGGKPLERVNVVKELRSILLKEAYEEGKGPIELSPPPPGVESQRVVPKIDKGRRRILSGVLGNIVNILAIASLLISLSLVSSLMTGLFEVMLFNKPISALVGALSLNRVLIHLALITPIFLLLFLISRRVRRPIIYIYTYLGSGLRRQLVQRQEPKPEEEGREEVIERMGLINIPLYASLRRLYKLAVEKGIKLLQVGGKKRRSYKLSYERRADRRLRTTVGKRSRTKARSERGRYISYELPKGRPWDLAFVPTIRAAAPYQRSRNRRGLALKVELDDIRVKVREMRAPITMVLLLDMSESMISSLENVRNAILSMRDTILKRRDSVGLVIFKGQGATTLQPPTRNLGLVVRRLLDVGASDLTPLASGMFEAWRVLRNEKVKNRDIIPFLVIISDGIANIPLESPLSPHTRRYYLNTAQADVIDVAYLLRRSGIRTMVINPAHIIEEEMVKRHRGVEEVTGKRFLEPTELLMEIPKITGGYYYGIGEEGELEEVFLTEALGLINR